MRASRPPRREDHAGLHASRRKARLPVAEVRLAARQGQDQGDRHQRQVPRRERSVAGGAHAQRGRRRASSAPWSRPARAGSTDLKSFGLEGTQSALLEVSALPPINLDGRLQYLIRYPHGCLEQTTSAAFPQLYLSALIKLDQNQRLQTENNIRAGIARLRSFQHTSGGFVVLARRLGPGSGTRLAQRLGHDLRRPLHARSREGWATRCPGDMKSAWLRYQKSARAALEPARRARQRRVPRRRWPKRRAMRRRTACTRWRWPARRRSAR